MITSVNPTALAANAGLMALLAHRIDAAEIPPYSLETLVKTGTRGLECLPNVDRVAAFLEEKLRNCYRAKSRAERMNRTLKLINTVNKNIFGFVVFTQPVHKFEYISEVISKLRDARNIIEVERDYDRARMVLRTIKGAALWDDFSPGVLSEINRMHRASGIIPRLCRCSVDLQDIFRALREKETPQHVVSHLDTLVQQTTKMAEVWGTEYEQALHSL